MAHVINRSADFTSATHRLRSNECTPEPDGNFVGILLNAPLEVAYSGTRAELDPRDSLFMICGLAAFQLGTLGLGTNFPQAILFIVTNTRTHVTYSAKMEPIRNALRAPTFPAPTFPGVGIKRPDPKDVEVTTYFNANLAELMPLPAVDADYWVHGVLGPYQSNMLDVKVKKRGGGSAWPA